MIDDLNRRFGHEDQLSFSLGQGTLPMALLQLPNGDSATVYLYGAHLTSWQHGGEERLFTSAKAIYGQGKAIRGGVPLIFPQFGAGPLPAHGFARTNNWSVVETKATKEQVSITMRLVSNSELQRFWNAGFASDLTITLSDSVTIDWSVSNTGQSAFSFQQALHTYFSIKDISKVRIQGLSGLVYLDNLKGKARELDSHEEAKIDSEVDRVYLDAPDVLSIIDEVQGSVIEIDKLGFKDAVLWNPWIEKSKGMADLQPEDYQRFVCLEVGNIGSTTELRAGEGKASRQVMRVK